MTNNDVLRSIASVLHLGDAQLSEIVRKGDGDVDPATIASYRKQSEEEGFAPCPHEVMAHFLQGLVIHRRGTRKEEPAAPLETPVTNNVILKKVRIAFELKDADIAAIFTKAGIQVSKSERSAFFRHPDHRHYRECGDAVLQNLLNGLTG